jgi:uncharacterized tellurite resistance protein B-like protein
MARPRINPVTNGTLRYGLQTTPEIHNKLSAIAKKFEISTSDVVDVLIENADVRVLAPKLIEKREEKGVTATKVKKEATDLLSKLSPTERARFMAMMREAAASQGTTEEAAQ